MTRPLILRSLVVVGAASLALAGCSSDSGSSDSSASPSADTSAAAGDGTLKIGTLLPQTGSLAFLGPPEFAGVDLAVQEINDAGGVNGAPVESVVGDSGDTSTNIASQTVDRQLSQGVDAIIGAASSSVSLTVIDKITSAGVQQVSPANTSPELSTYPDKGLYARTAPPDTFQGQVLGDLVAGDGHTSAAILALDDAYGTGLADNVEKAYTAAGGTVSSKQIYDPKAASYEAEVSEAKASNPEAVVLIGFDESSKIIQEMIKQGIGPNKVPLYLVDGNLSNTLYQDLPKGSMEGTQGTLPGAEASSEFQAKLKEINPDLEDFSYAPEAYDAAVIIALAAEYADNDSGRAIGDTIKQVTADGEKCTTYADCKQLIEDGKDPDYDGQSGPIDLNDVGDPSKAIMGIYTYGPDNTYTRTGSQEGDVPDASQG
ncbi:MAG: ABC transporter substrate-binding protein [Candidatus Nanopelagicales bacterium]|jgi:branched-chain amino acid transport system substrate-binding protein|nr:ABC transporter substrate-binding protein [Candidatus Nanopelagicales bacterium]MCU0294452.1 ABC transporter substrate-binding protein [Candidatus Nanopelagicales bacterium]